MSTILFLLPEQAILRNLSVSQVKTPSSCPTSASCLQRGCCSFPYFQRRPVRARRHYTVLRLWSVHPVAHTPPCRIRMLQCLRSNLRAARLDSFLAPMTLEHCTRARVFCLDDADLFASSAPPLRRRLPMWAPRTSIVLTHVRRLAEGARFRDHPLRGPRLTSLAAISQMGILVGTVPRHADIPLPTGCDASLVPTVPCSPAAAVVPAHTTTHTRLREVYLRTL